MNAAGSIAKCNRPLIVGVGGTLRPGSSSECALRIALNAAARLGADTDLVVGRDLILPAFDPLQAERTPEALRLISLLRRCDGILIASPGYHGSLSGLVKNALDYTEDMRQDARPYFDGRAVGSIVCANGWQATGTTLSALRAIVHALRGWPSPLGVAINTALNVFDENGGCLDSVIVQQLELISFQVVTFAKMHQALALQEEVPIKNHR